MHIATSRCRWATPAAAYQWVPGCPNSYRRNKGKLPDMRLSQAAYGPQLLLFSYSFPSISYAASITSRQKSVLGRLLAVWNYANVASIGQYVCPISERPVSPDAFHTPIWLDRLSIAETEGRGLIEPVRAAIWMQSRSPLNDCAISFEPYTEVRLGGWRRVERNDTGTSRPGPLTTANRGLAKWLIHGTERCHSPSRILPVAKTATARICRQA